MPGPNETPLFIRPLTEDEQRKIQAGVRSSDAFILRRRQLLLASVRGERVPKIALQLAGGDQTVCNVIHGFNADGLSVLEKGSSRPHRLRTTFSPESVQQLPAILHRRPQECGKESGQWTLELVAHVRCEQGLTTTLVSDESVRRSCKRLTIQWKRAKPWITGAPVRYSCRILKSRLK